MFLLNRTPASRHPTPAQRVIGYLSLACMLFSSTGCYTWREVPLSKLKYPARRGTRFRLTDDTGRVKVLTLIELDYPRIKGWDDNDRMIELNLSLARKIEIWTRNNLLTVGAIVLCALPVLVAFVWLVGRVFSFQ